MGAHTSEKSAIDCFINETKFALSFLAKEVNQLKKGDVTGKSQKCDIEAKVIHLEKKLRWATDKIATLVEEQRRDRNEIDQLSLILSEIRDSSNLTKGMNYSEADSAPGSGLYDKMKKRNYNSEISLNNKMEKQHCHSEILLNVPGMRIAKKNNSIPDSTSNHRHRKIDKDCMSYFEESLKKVPSVTKTHHTVGLKKTNIADDNSTITDVSAFAKNYMAFISEEDNRTISNKSHNSETIRKNDDITLRNETATDGSSLSANRQPYSPVTNSVPFLKYNEPKILCSISEQPRYAMRDKKPNRRDQSHSRTAHSCTNRTEKNVSSYPRGFVHCTF